MSSEPQEDSFRDQLSSAEETFRLCEGTIVQNENEELCGKRRLLDITWNPQLQLHHTVLPQHFVTEEDNVCYQQRNLRMEQEEPEPPQVKEEQEEPEPPQVKEEQEEPEPPNIKDEQEEPDTPQVKEEKWEVPQLLLTKQEQEEFCISQNEEQLYLKQETKTLIEIPTFDEHVHSEADLNNQQSFNGTDSQNEEGNQHEESTSNADEETEPQNIDQRKRRDRSHVQSSNKRLVKSDERSITHEGEKPFLCKECDKSFHFVSNLRTHMRTHTGEKPFLCKECDKSFRFVSNLKTHTRTHTGEKPFLCEECDKSFNQISHLTKHMRTHTGEKPFSCTQCNKSYRNRWDLKKHIRIHTAENPLFFVKFVQKNVSLCKNLKGT